MSKKSGDGLSTEHTFESAQQRLREIVQRMEDPDLPLEESLTLFEEGSRLAKHCQSLLDRAEARIELLVGEAEGVLRTEPLREIEPRERDP